MHSLYEPSRNTRDTRTEALEGNNYLDKPFTKSGIHICGELLEEVERASKCRLCPLHLSPNRMKSPLGSDPPVANFIRDSLNIC